MKNEQELRKIEVESEEYNKLTTDEMSEVLSFKIFDKPMKELKYLLCTNYIHDQLLKENLTRTGLYQWINVFRGEVKAPRDVLDYNDYDIVQVNMSGQDIHLVGTIREQLKEQSTTKLVLNNDYTTELWGVSFDWPDTIAREVVHADMLFGTEYFQTTALTELSGRECYVIPHPAYVKRLKHLPKIENKEIITTIWRRYDAHSYIPSLAVRNHGITTQLIGYDISKDRKPYVTTTLYDYVFAGTNYFEFCNQMRESKIVYNPFTFHSYDRTTVDCAAMGVAMVTSNRTQSSNICYPHTCVDPFDVKKSREMINKLNNDKDFYDLVVKTAQEKSEFYNHSNSKLRYFTALYESLKKGRIPSRNIKRKKELVRGVGDDALSLSSKSIERKNEKKN